MTPDALKSNITRGAGMALAWAAGRYHLDPTQVGAMMSDAGYVGAVAGFVYGVVQHWGMKKVPENSTAIDVRPGNVVPAPGSPIVATVTGRVVG